MKSYFYLTFILLSISCSNALNSGTSTQARTEQQPTEKFKPEWESLKKHQTPKWFLDAKFGIYCHWGPYSVPAFENEWYSHWMYCNKNNPEFSKGKKIHDHHIKTYGPLHQFGYKDFIPMFKAEKFDASEWADVFEKSGAKFAGPVSEHADGFAMWNSRLTTWDAMDKGPKRDVMGELAREIRKRDMKFVATFHRHWLLGWYPTWDESTDASEPEYAGLYGPKMTRGDFKYPPRPVQLDQGFADYYPLADKPFNEEWLARLKEIIDNYSPDLFWFDNKMDVIGEEYRQEFLAYYYNQAAKNAQPVVATYKFYDFVRGTAVLDLERARMSEKKDFPWLTDDSIDWNAWCHISHPDYKSANRIIDFLVDVVSKNGCLLLNITPTAEGLIPEPVKERLLDIGEWLDINGEGIYGTRPWTIAGEGPSKVVEGHLSEYQNSDNTAEDIRFTTKDKTLYAIVLDWPEHGETIITSLKAGNSLLNKSIDSIELLGHRGNLSFESKEDGLHIMLPHEKTGDHAFVLKIRPL